MRCRGRPTFQNLDHSRQIFASTRKQFLDVLPGLSECQYSTEERKVTYAIILYANPCNHVVTELKSRQPSIETTQVPLFLLKAVDVFAQEL